MLAGKPQDLIGVIGHEFKESSVEERLWTVVRFPNGSWSYGGKPTDPDYSECEIWQIPASSPEKAVKKAQAKRARDRKKAAAAS